MSLVLNGDCTVQYGTVPIPVPVRYRPYGMVRYVTELYTHFVIIRVRYRYGTGTGTVPYHIIISFVIYAIQY